MATDAVRGEDDAPRSRVEHGLDRLVGAASWLWVALLAVIVASVLLRTLFSIARIELEELQWHLYAVGFLAGILGGVLHDRHVRVDVLRERMDRRRRDGVELYGLLLLQLPFLALVLWSALPLVAESLATGERSTSAGGLPHRWLVKSALPATGLLLVVASFARLRHIGRRLFADDDRRGDGDRGGDSNGNGGGGGDRDGDPDGAGATPPPGGRSLGTRSR